MQLTRSPPAQVSNEKKGGTVVYDNPNNGKPGTNIDSFLSMRIAFQ